MHNWTLVVPTADPQCRVRPAGKTLISLFLSFDFLGIVELPRLIEERFIRKKVSRKGKSAV